MVRTSLTLLSALLAVSAAEPPRSLLPRSASLEQDDVSLLHEPSEAALHAGRRRDALSPFAHGTLTMAALGVALLSTALLPVALLTTASPPQHAPPHHAPHHGHDRHRVKYNRRRTEALTSENTAPIRIAVGQG